MRNIETEIEALKSQIAMLEKEQREGYSTFTSEYNRYSIDATHDVVMDVSGMILAIIVDEEAVRKYLADKGAA